jgi:apolipoprotein N-acyltransferase
MMEWHKSNGYFGFPWGLLPHTVQNVPLLIQIADLTGVYGLSFLLALGNAVLAEAAWQKIMRFIPSSSHRGTENKKLKFLNYYIAVFFLMLTGTVVYGAWRLEHPVPVQKTIPLVLIQHNVDQYLYAEEALAKAIELSRQGAAFLEKQGKEAAMIVWSETVLTRPFKDSRFYHSPIPFLEQSKIPVLFGAPLVSGQNSRKETVEFFNGAILVQQGRIISTYGKQRLIPFAETVPFGNTKLMQTLMEKFVGFSSGWSIGRESVVMEIPGLKFGVPICFEDAFAGLCRNFIKGGAEILVNLTNDSWSQSASAEAQHLAAARFRAVENRRGPGQIYQLWLYGAD